jgi:hypothetical protein
VSTPRGRRPGAPDTRAAILGAARASFADKGYAGTTIRGIAGAAGVDAALVDPREVLGPAMVGGAEGAGERLLRVFLSLWDDPEIAPVLVGIVRSALQPGGERLLTEGFVPVVLLPIGAALGIDRPEVRMPLVISQVGGLILTRYVIALEPIASMSADAVVAAYAPTLQRYLTGDID